MAISLAKDSGNADPYSQTGGSDPVSISVTINGADETGIPADQLWCYFNDDSGSISSYSGITVSIVTETDTGVNWELSLDGSTGWGNSISLSNQDVSSTAQAVRVYAHAIVTDGTATATYTAADVKIAATENPV